jgi:hypothetical protein
MLHFNNVQMKKIEIMNRLKKYLPVLLVLFIVTSCFKESNLDLKPLGDTEADIFDEALDFEHAMLGTYSKVQDLYVYNADNWLHGMWLLPGDDLTPDAGTNPFEVFNTLQPGDGKLNRYFDLMYHLVNRTNTNLEKIAMDEERDESAFEDLSQRDHLKGESLFLRGWANFSLWNYFGTAPVVTERIVSTDKIHPAGSDGIQLLDQAISDFTAAAALLPDSWSAANRGRATKNSANGYLGKALVFKASWTGDNALYGQAITAFDKITGRSLVANYGDNFIPSAENNDESLFESQAGQPDNDNVWLANDDFSVVGQWSAYYSYFDNGQNNFSGIKFLATQKLVDAIDPDDPRLPYIVDPATRQVQKYMLEIVKTNSGTSTINNPRLMRLADALLLKAEAMNETGNQAGAIALINQVRTRARNMGSTGVPADHPTTGASQAQVRQWIMDERFVELAAEEGHRWLDLRRWHKAGLIELESFDFDSDVGSFAIEMPKHLLFPIPNGEIDFNSNIAQNDGY